MTLVMFHSGTQLPDFLTHTFGQLRKYNKDVPVYFITDRQWMANPIFTLHNIHVVDKQDCYTEDIYLFEKLFGRGKDDFWTITTTRLMYIAAFINNNNLHDVYHYENDVLIYYNLKEHHSTFTHHYTDIAITYGGPDKIMTGFMFVKNPKALRALCDFIVSLLKQHSIREIRKMYGMDMVNEMTLLRAYSKEHPERIVPLPILPFGEWSKDYELYNSIFDPASWGQYVGGTPEGIPGVKPEDHYIGQLLRAHTEYTIEWKKSIPYFVYDGQSVKINNLHIHSKRLHLYISG
jgi:hypothetical protein